MKFFRQIYKQSQLLILLVVAMSVTASWADVDFDHKPVKKSNSGERIPILTSIKGEDVRTARAYFKSALGSRYFFAPLQSDGTNKYRGMLPAPRLGSNEVSYFLLAATNSGQILKTDTYVIDIKDDEDALARSEIRDAKDIDIDIDNFEKAKKLIDQLGTTPDPTQQVPVGSETAVQNTQQIPGFQDNIVAAQQPGMLASAVPVAASSGLGTKTWIGVGVAAVAVVAIASGGGGGGSGGDTPAPAGVQLGGNITPPNGPQQSPISMELIPVGGAAVSPVRLRYDGSDLGTWSGTAIQDFGLPTLGRRLELILTQDVTGGNFRLHFQSNGGQINTGVFNGTAGDFIVALPQ